MAASLALAFALPAVASAETTPPTIIESSIDGGWTAAVSAVAVRYSTPLALSSTAALTDRTGAAVAGHSIVHMNVITFIPHVALKQVDGPFQSVFAVRVWWQSPSYAPTVSTLPFRIDTTAPRKPDVDVDTVSIPDPTDRVPGGRSLVRVSADDPTQQLVLTGLAMETGIKASFDWSGVARVEARFFDRGGVERTNLRRSFALNCEPNCSYEAAIDIDTSHVPTGVWTVRINSFDRATNRSADSDPVTFVRLPK